jgi:flagellin
MLQRVRDLAVQYNNGTLATADKAAITAEVAQLCTEISKIGNDTKFNGIALLSGGAAITFQVGAADGQTISLTGYSLFGSGSTFEVDSNIFSWAAGSAVTLASIDAAIANVSDTRGALGATQNRLEHTLNNLATYQENLTASESRIRDVDMASEMVEFTKLQILQQAGTSMLAQANQSSQSVLSLLR